MLCQPHEIDHNVDLAPADKTRNVIVALLLNVDEMLDRAFDPIPNRRSQIRPQR